MAVLRCVHARRCGTPPWTLASLLGVVGVAMVDMLCSSRTHPDPAHRVALIGHRARSASAYVCASVSRHYRTVSGTVRCSSLIIACDAGPGALFGCGDRRVSLPSAVSASTAKASSRRSRSAYAVPPGHLTLSVAPLASAIADSSHLPYRHRSFIDTGLSFTPKPFRRVERSSLTISTCFTYPQPIPRSDVPHTPCTVGSNSGRHDRPGGLYPLRVGVTMSIHKLTAGSGYDYLTRQVAALDATEKGHTGLASYYAERGESPGVWIGSGLGGIDGLTVGDPVTAEQMRALFGCGLHPLAELRQLQLEGPDLTERDYQDAPRLGAPFKIVDGEVSPFRLEIAKRIGAIQRAAGLPAGAALPAADRARVRTEVAREFFLAEHGRDPIDARELAGQIAKNSRPRTQTVAGYDLTFSPVKSVSTLWAVAEPAVAAVIERAHQAAVKDALLFIEKHALFTRTGPQGIRQVNVRGLVATAFTHRDSRAGDPDLHTHVAVANKVQTLDGRWLSIDGRVLFKANVAASETYNTALEQHLRDESGCAVCRTARYRSGEAADPGDRRCRPSTEPALVDPPCPHRDPPRRAGDPVPA